jgi:SAM-dependent methyltransferase
MDDQITDSNEAAWNLAAKKYEYEFEQDVEFLRAGGISLSETEQRILGDLSGCDLAIVLQCSHGLDALSLLSLGVSTVIGLDISERMLALAKAKSSQLGSSARWIHADVLNPPTELFASADLVYTGKGSLPWVTDLTKWAEVIRNLLRPGGRLFVHESHPLNWIWDAKADSHRLSHDRSYFDEAPRPNETFPASAVGRFAPVDQPPPVAWEHQWTLGTIVTTLVEAGLHLQRLEEHDELWWPQFPDIPVEEFARIPHMFSLMAIASQE